MRRNNKNATECFNFPSITWGDDCLSKATVYRIFSEFSTGCRQEFSDASIAGRPKTANSSVNSNMVKNLIDEDPQ